MVNKNQEILSEFTSFCEAHPELRFWQAQLAWMKEKYDASFSAILVDKEGKKYDTFNWTGEDNPAVLFGEPD